MRKHTSESLIITPTALYGEDNNTIYMLSSVAGTSQIYHIDYQPKRLKLTEGKHNYVSLSLGADGFIATRQSMSQPTEIYSVIKIQVNQQSYL